MSVACVAGSNVPLTVVVGLVVANEKWMRTPAQGPPEVSRAVAVRSKVSAQLDNVRGAGLTVILARAQVAVCKEREAVAFPDFAVMVGGCEATVSVVMALPWLSVRTGVPVWGSRTPEVVVKRTS